jgi:hypothetical protein
MLSYNFFGVLFNTTKLGKRNLESKEVGEKFFFVLLYKAHAPMLAVKKLTNRPTDQPAASW